MARPTKKSKDGAPSSRDILLDCASQILRESDEGVFSLHDIARRSGFNHAMIRYYFGNKDGFIHALAEREVAPMVESINRLREKDMPAQRKLEMHIAAMIDGFARFPYLRRISEIIFSQQSQSAAQGSWRLFIEPIVAFHSDLVEQGVREGTMRRVDPLFFHFAIIGACGHLFSSKASLRLGYGIEELDSDILDRYTKYVTHLFLVGGGPTPLDQEGAELKTACS